MGNVPPGMGGEGGPPGGDNNNKKDEDADKKKKKRFEPRPRATGARRRKRRQGPSGIQRVPTVLPTSKCKLRMMKLERVKDFLLMEQEFIRNHEVFKPREERDQEEREKLEELRGSHNDITKFLSKAAPEGAGAERERQIQRREL